MATAYDLQPLQFGDHLSRGTSLYTRRWFSIVRWFLLTWFVPMALLSFALDALLDPYQWAERPGREGPSVFSMTASAAYWWLLATLGVTLAGWVPAAGLYFIGARHYVGDEPTLAQTARAVLKRIGPLTAVSLTGQAVLAGLLLVCVGPAFLLYESEPIVAWMYMLFLGLPALFLVLALLVGKWGLAPVCVMLDDADAGAAFSRSATLSRGFIWRLYMLLVVGVLVVGLPGQYSVVGTGGLLLRELLAREGLHVLGDVARWMWDGLVLPMLFLPLVAYYFDQRCRKEGYDIAVMARNFGIDGQDMLRFQADPELGYLPRGFAAPVRQPRQARAIRAPVRRAR